MTTYPSLLRASFLVVSAGISFSGCGGSGAGEAGNPAEATGGSAAPASGAGGSQAGAVGGSGALGAAGGGGAGANGAGASETGGGDVIASGGIAATGGQPSVSTGGGGAAGGAESSSGGSGVSASGGSVAATGGAGSAGVGATGGMVSQEGCIGWASVEAEGLIGTTGGEGGPVVEITTAEELASYRRDTTPMILRIMNDISGEIELGSNKTVEGAVPGITVNGSLSFSGTADASLSNLIVRNLRINAVTSSEDGMDIRYAHHACVEHCEFIDGPDGNLDIVSEANYVTVAYNKFYYTAAYQALPGETSTEHRYSNLVGSSNTTQLDRDKLKVTFHHNWWAEGVIERMPRVRFGEVHIFNNYYSSEWNNYCIAAGIEAKLLIENNFFENVNDPHIFYSGELTAQIVATGNEYVNTTGLQESGQGDAFAPPYAYQLEPGVAVKASVMASAGPR